MIVFCHSLASDWNHGNAHFLRGVARALVARGHEVVALEPAGAWSVRNLVAERGPAALGAWWQVAQPTDAHSNTTLPRWADSESLPPGA